MDLPKAEHVTGNLSVDVTEFVIAYSAPMSSVPDLKSSFITQSTAGQPHFYTG